MKKLFTFLIGGAIAIPLSVLATAQIERTLNPLWGVETEVDDNNLLAAKTLKEKVDGNDASYSLKLTELQKTRLLKHSKTKSATGNERIPMRSVINLRHPSHSRAMLMPKSRLMCRMTGVMAQVFK